MSQMRSNGQALWAFSLAVYAGPGVKGACLALQDDFDADVNILLLAAWAGAARQLLLDHDDFRRILRASADWRDHVVRPLRRVRRAVGARLDRLPEGIDPYAALKAAELATEQTQQHMLALALSGLEHHSSHRNGEALAAANMMTYMAVLGRDDSPDLSGPVAVIAGAAAGPLGAPQDKTHLE